MIDCCVSLMLLCFVLSRPHPVFVCCFSIWKMIRNIVTVVLLYSVPILLCPLMPVPVSIRTVHHVRNVSVVHIRTEQDRNRNVMKVRRLNELWKKNENENEENIYRYWN